MTPEQRAEKIFRWFNLLVSKPVDLENAKENLAAEIRAAVKEAQKVEHDHKYLTATNKAFLEGRAEAFEEAAKIADGRKFYDPEGFLSQAIRARAKELK